MKEIIQIVGLCYELGSSSKFRGNDRDDNEGMGKYSCPMIHMRSSHWGHRGTNWYLETDFSDRPGSVISAWRIHEMKREAHYLI